MIFCKKINLKKSCYDKYCYLDLVFAVRQDNDGNIPSTGPCPLTDR